MLSRPYYPWHGNMDIRRLSESPGDQPDDQLLLKGSEPADIKLALDLQVLLIEPAAYRTGVPLRIVSEYVHFFLQAPL